MSNKHRTNFIITIARWVHGKLRLLFVAFRKLEDAICHALSVECDNFKIHDRHGKIVAAGGVTTDCVNYA